MANLLSLEAKNTTHSFSVPEQKTFLETPQDSVINDISLCDIQRRQEEINIEEIRVKIASLLEVEEACIL